MSFKPIPSPERWHGLAACGGLLLLDLLLVLLIRGRSVDGLSFVLGLLVLLSLLVVGYLAYRTAGAFTLEYWVDRDAVTLVWGLTRQVIPIGQIRRVQRGALPSAGFVPAFWHWPYRERQRVECDGLGVVNAYATRSLPEQVILVTDTESYGLSPVDPEGLLKALQSRYALGVARSRTLELQRPPLWTWPLWRDANALFLIAVGGVGVLLLFGVLCFRFPGLPSDLPLHFDVNGLPDRIASKNLVFSLPVMGLLTWVLNVSGGIWIYRRVQRHGAYLLWGGAVIVELIAGLALLNLTRW